MTKIGKKLQKFDKQLGNFFLKKNDKQLGKKMTKNWGKMSKYLIFSAKIISFFHFFFNLKLLKLYF